MELWGLPEVRDIGARADIVEILAFTSPMVVLADVDLRLEYQQMTVFWWSGSLTLAFTAGAEKRTVRRGARTIDAALRKCILMEVLAIELGVSGEIRLGRVDRQRHYLENTSRDSLAYISFSLLA